MPVYTKTNAQNLPVQTSQLQPLPPHPWPPRSPWRRSERPPWRRPPSPARRWPQTATRDSRTAVARRTPQKTTTLWQVQSPEGFSFSNSVWLGHRHVSFLFYISTLFLHMEPSSPDKKPRVFDCSRPEQSMCRELKLIRWKNEEIIEIPTAVCNWKSSKTKTANMFFLFWHLVAYPVKQYIFFISTNRNTHLINFFPVILFLNSLEHQITPLMLKILIFLPLLLSWQTNKMSFSKDFLFTKHKNCTFGRICLIFNTSWAARLIIDFL